MSEPEDGAMVEEVEVAKAENGEWFWRARAFNGRIVATAGETYENKDHATRMAKALFPDAELELVDE